MILSDKEILKTLYCDNPMIFPFVNQQVRSKEDEYEKENGGYAHVPVISYGLSSFGYDIRAGRYFKVYTNLHNSVIDPKDFDPDCFVSRGNVDECIIPPNSFALAESFERFDIPEDILAICVGKSTYARCGIIINVTPLEPGWKGVLTLEISNTTPCPVRIYAEEGIAQLIFFRGEYPAVSYKDRNGKYQNQNGIVLPRV